MAGVLASTLRVSLGMPQRAWRRRQRASHIFNPIARSFLTGHECLRWTEAPHGLFDAPEVPQ
jgi:hypothetical protein